MSVAERAGEAMKTALAEKLVLGAYQSWVVKARQKLSPRNQNATRRFCT